MVNDEKMTDEQKVKKREEFLHMVALFSSYDYGLDEEDAIELWDWVDKLVQEVEDELEEQYHFDSIEE